LHAETLKVFIETAFFARICIRMIECELHLDFVKPLGSLVGSPGQSAFGLLASNHRSGSEKKKDRVNLQRNEHKKG